MSLKTNDNLYIHTNEKFETWTNFPFNGTMIACHRMVYTDLTFMYPKLIAVMVRRKGFISSTLCHGCILHLFDIDDYLSLALLSSNMKMSQENDYFRWRTDYTVFVDTECIVYISCQFSHQSRLISLLLLELLLHELQKNT